MKKLLISLSFILISSIVFGCTGINSQLENNHERIKSMQISYEDVVSQNIEFNYFMKITGSVNLIDLKGEKISTDNSIEMMICKQFVGYSQYRIEISIPSSAGMTKYDGSFEIYVSSDKSQQWDELANRVVLPYSYYTLTFSKEGFHPVTIVNIPIFDDGIDFDAGQINLDMREVE